MTVVLVAGCSNADAPPPRNDAGAAIECAGSDALDPSARLVVQEIRRAAETGSAFQALASTAPLRSCRAVSESGQTSVEYLFANGGTLTFTRNLAIEYTDQEVRFGSARGDNIIEVLKRIERESFSPDGCGIDWQDETPLESADGVAETGYYGETCNCQARVRADGAGRVAGFVFRSTC